MMPRPMAGTCWRCGIGDQLGLGELVLLAPGDQAHGTVGQRVAHPLGVGAVGQGEAEAVLRAEHVHGRAVDGAGPPPDVDHDAEAGRPAGHMDGDLVRDGPVEARHAPAQAGRARRTWGDPDAAAPSARSYQRQPPVDGQDLPGDVARLVREQEDRHRRHLPRRALTAERHR